MTRGANKTERDGLGLISGRVGCAIVLLAVAVVALFVFLIWHWGHPMLNDE
jgi:hypothetical protein